MMPKKKWFKSKKKKQAFVSVVGQMWTSTKGTPGAADVWNPDMGHRCWIRRAKNYKEWKNEKNKWKMNKKEEQEKNIQGRNFGNLKIIFSQIFDFENHISWLLRLHFVSNHFGLHCNQKPYILVRVGENMRRLQMPLTRPSAAFVTTHLTWTILSVRGLWWDFITPLWLGSKSRRKGLI